MSTKILLDQACENLRKALSDPKAPARRDAYLKMLENKWKCYYDGGIRR